MRSPSTASTKNGRLPSVPAIARRLAGTPLPLVALVVVAAIVIAEYATRAYGWVVMTDELEHVKLARSIWDHASLSPTIRGVSYGSYDQLYELVLAPFTGLLPAPTAYRWMHAVNGVLFASAAIPAFLLARAAGAPRWAGLVVASLTVAVPWTVLAATLMAESAAYPAFLWSMLAICTAMAAPTWRRELLALAAIGLAFAARTQFVYLAALFPIAALTHDLAYAAASSRRGARREALVSVVRGLPRRRPVLLAAVVLGAVLWAAGLLDRISGSYAGAVTGDLLPEGVWRSTAVHFDYVAVAAGALPALLAVAWLLATTFRPTTRRRHALAVLVLVTVPSTVLVAASFDLRFAYGAVHDRYAFYVAPLLFLGAVMLLVERPPAWTMAVAAALFAFVGHFAGFAPATTPYYNSPAALFHPVIDGQTSRLRGLPLLSGLSASTVVIAATVLLGIGTVVALRRLPRRIALPGVVAVMAALVAIQTVYAYQRVYLGRPGPSAVLFIGDLSDGADWVDDALPDGARAGLIAAGEKTYEQATNPYWTVEFWNRTVDREYGLGSEDRFTPFPTAPMTLDREAGSVDLADHPPPTRYLLQWSSDLRFRIRGRRLATMNGFALIDAGRRPQLDWWADLGTAPAPLGLPRTLKVLARTQPRTMHVVVGPAAPPADPATQLGEIDVRSGDRTARRTVSGAAPVEAAIRVCPPRRGAWTDVVVSARTRPGEDIALLDAWTTPASGGCPPARR